MTCYFEVRQDEKNAQWYWAFVMSMAKPRMS